MIREGADRRAVLLLLAGALVGIGLAAASIVRSGRAQRALPPDGVAVVNGEVITQEAFAEFVGALASERKSIDLDAPTRQRLLDRMIDEELLLQRGIELGLPRYERSARRAIVAAVVSAVTTEAEASEPNEDELRAFYRDFAERFMRPGRVELEVAAVQEGGRSEAEAYRRAAELARRAREGEDFAALAAQLGDTTPLVPPREPIALDEVRERLGPSAALAVERLHAGEVSDPVRGSAGYFVIALRGRAAAELLPFEQVRDSVRAEYLRSVGERALARYLAQLRASADVRARSFEAPPR
ncbi:MAG TPA: peptidylprolyl isomerase [Myxococcota bacterium]|nr:peptidylprolyl isomerase [Myxococcota bacterium]